MSFINPNNKKHIGDHHDAAEEYRIAIDDIIDEYRTALKNGASWENCVDDDDAIRLAALCALSERYFNETEWAVDGCKPHLIRSLALFFYNGSSEYKSDAKHALLRYYTNRISNDIDATLAHQEMYAPYDREVPYEFDEPEVAVC